ncbi:2-keto-4-pentenoate hydratase/2-oxohepta-3-ene-1,7-dioic acid hydratase (catechol pathway) [Nakamurella panacisegetis]|uniref:2-keto-4-pentenoate hydratase/2-oxohepta-3-ene-1,7-dioic acid hydratase (Catechol pathway) n=1 Tax=Nakamurella panacisegetis TaxID=1090615 RepID=A0A1H0HX49_9ACTN|nr:fumarylacetoacetate hydrolase family protein [Nakamurella panacisegetis]SDO23768.1 2-keto-4-pentenoate hydratase/2-oxohepta-3-ene-1,7-dioic acid hydratase (catechol pathway) [Nakamurella panacisegetis]
MRLARIAHPSGVAFVVVEGTDEDNLVAKEIVDHPFGTPEFTGREWPLGQTRLLAPILPSKVVAVGRNYADHAAELGNAVPDEPLIFIKPSTSVIGPGAPIQIPPSSSRVEFEGELAVVIGRPCRDVKAENASSVILGYTVANDVTARDLQRADVQFTRGKGFDSFCPIGPWIETELDPSDVEIRTELDDEVKQDGHTADMVHSVAAQIEFISAIMTLLPGDVILTGTPAGVGPMVAGQTVSVTVEGIGTLTNPVVDR